MATEPPGKHPDTAREPDDRVGVWQVAPAWSARAPADCRPAARRRVGQDLTAVRDPIGPEISPDHRAAGDLDAILLLSGSWPRVFPGL